MALNNHATVYTDGACSGNPGPGGWAAIVASGDAILWRAGREERTTNNRMELLAAIHGLAQTPPGSSVVLYSDSQYLVNTMTKGWQRKVNQDLWQQLDQAALGRRVRWEWVRGHDGDHWNTEADKLARAASQDAGWGERSGAFAGAAAPPSSGKADVPSTAEQPRLSHLDEQGHARMVDVSGKDETAREATAEASVFMQPATLALILEGGGAKGDVFTVAQVAGVMAAKRTSDLIPLCHPLPLTRVELAFVPDTATSSVTVRGTVRTTAKTGVEMEALCAVAVASLTIYDMCKAADRGMRVDGLRVTHKAGGKSGTFSQA